MATQSPQQPHLSEHPTQHMHPRMQVARVTTLGLLGDLALLAIPLLTLAAAGCVVWLSLATKNPLDWLLMEILVAFSVIGLLASIDLLLTRPTQPQGIVLKKNQARELFAMIRRRTDQFKMPMVNRVLITQQPKLELILTPSRGLPGACVQTLAIGWPLLSFLSGKQFRAALGGVLGQWSERHAGIIASICRRNAFWQGLSAHHAQRRFPAAWLLRRPIQWFATYFQQQSAEICRSQILEHDRYVLETGDDEQALSLIASEILAESFLEKKFWPMILAAAQRSPDPVVKPYTNFNAVADRTLNKEDANRWLLQALAAPSTNQQTSIRERLAVLGYSGLHWSGLPQQTTMDILFGRHWQALAARLDHQWQTGIQQEWTDRHWRYRQDQEQFEVLQQKAGKEAITGAAAIRYIRLAEQFMEKDQRVALCKRLLRVNRTHADVCFQCGKQLIEAGNDDGIRAIEIAIQLDLNYNQPGDKLIRNFERTNRVVSFRQAVSA